MPKPRKVKSASQRREAEHKAFLRALNTMSRLAMKQAEVLGSFMKTYEVTSLPESRVMSDERELLAEIEDQRQIADEFKHIVDVPNPFLN
jgi:hypothetical protein